MPTGYTASVQDGTITEFSEFALQCARAFGACIDMRDDPADRPIPEKFEASSYHQEQLAAAKTRRGWLVSLTPAQVAQECEKAFHERRGRDEQYARRKVEAKERYEAMLANVRAWQAPSEDHIKFKEFMEEQLATSIDHDCRDFEREAVFMDEPEEWLRKVLNECAADIEYHTKEHTEEIRRTENRNRWVRLLRESLAS